MRLLLLCLLALCTDAFAANFAVAVGGNAGLVFTPRDLQIRTGDTVTFTNAGGFHNVVSQAAGFRCAQGCDGQGGNGNSSTALWSVTITFNTPGTFDIYCEPHGSPGVGMAGTIRVTQAATNTIDATYTGAWFDPAQSGHGLLLEVLPNNQLLAWWFTFSPTGQQAWFGGVGPITGNTATIAVAQTQGGRFIPNFNPSQITNPPWGTLNFTFTSCSSGRVDFASNAAAGFGTGTMQLTRLTVPAGITCPPPATTVAP